ncbi:MAG: tyrosine--tRNA ligase, partial [Chloroflexota bacterium]
ADGTKYGKTESGALFLNPALTSPYAFYQYFLNQDDADIGALQRIFSFKAQGEVEALEAETAQRPEARGAQQSLASELTELVHGADAAAQAASASGALFGRGELRELDAGTLAAALAELPNAQVSGPMPTVADLLVVSGLAESRTSARRTVADGGAYLNNQRVADPEMIPAESDLLHGRWLVLRRGKRSLAAVERVT